MAEDRITYEELVNSKQLLSRWEADFKKMESVAKKSLSNIKKDAGALFKGVKSTADIQKDVEKLKKLVNDLTATKKAQEQVDKGLYNIEVKRQALQKQEAQLLANQKEEVRKLTREKQLKAKAETAEANSINKLKAENNKLVSELHKLNLATDKGRKQAKQYQKQIMANEKQLKKFDAAIGRHQRNVGNYKSALQGATKLLGVFGVALGGAAMIGFFKNSISKFGEQEKAEKALEVALGKTSKALLNQASALQAVTKFGDEATIQGQAFLAQMGLTENQILKVTPAVLDFAEAQGMNVSDAFKLVAKSLGSSTNALSRYGITIEGAVGSSERLDMAVNALNTAFGGQAEAAAKAGTGALTQLSNLWGDLQERVGGFIANALNPLVKTVSGWLDVSEKQSTQLKRERQELNIYFSLLKSNNTTQGTRQKILNKINEEYDEYLPKLLNEKSTIEDLVEAQDALNKVMLERTIAQMMIEDIDEFNKTIVESADRMYESEVATAEFTESMKNADFALEEMTPKFAKFSTEAQAALKENAPSIDKITAKYQRMAEILGVAWENVQSIFSAGGESVAGSTPVSTGRVSLAEAETSSEISLQQAVTDEKIRLDNEVYANREMKMREFGEMSEEALMADVELNQEVADAKQALAYNSLSAGFDIFRSFKQREINALEKQREYELSLAEGNAQEQERINEEYDAKVNEQRRKQDRAAKIQSLFDVAINTAVGITKTIGTVGMPAAIPLVVLTAALGAIQAAAIAARPLPQYARGTKAAPEGWSVVGEEGNEMLVSPSGEISMTGDRAEVRYLEEGTEVVPNRELQKRLAGLTDRRLTRYNDKLTMKKMEDLQKQQLRKTDRTNELLSKFRYNIGKKVYDLNGNFEERV